MLKVIEKIKNKRMLITQCAAAASVMIMTASTTAFAATNEWATNASSWIVSGAVSIAAGAIALYIVKYIFKRQVMALISFIVVGAVVLFIAQDPTRLVTIGSTLWKVIFGG